MRKKNQYFTTWSPSFLAAGRYLFKANSNEERNTESGVEKKSDTKTESEDKETVENPATGGVPVDAESDKENQPPEVANESEDISGADPNIPPRSPDAMSGSQFATAYERVQNDPKERQKLIMEQFAKGNVPSNFRHFEPITIEKGGQTLTIFAARRAVTIGEEPDTFEIPMDGPTSRAVADMNNCTIPTSWLSDKIYEHAKAKGNVVPLINQDQFAQHDGTRMQRMEWMRKQQNYQKYKDAFAGMPDDELVAGYFKDVVHPIPGMTARFRDGVEIYGGYDASGRVQPLSGRHHNETYLDYSHRTRLISRVAYLNGKKVNLRDIINDPEVARNFGFNALDIDKSYDYSTWSRNYDAALTQSYVQAYRKAHPPGEKPASPAPDTAVAAANPPNVDEPASDTAAVTAVSDDTSPSPALTDTTVSAPAAPASAPAEPAAEPQPVQAPTEQPAPPQPAETQTPPSAPSGGGSQSSPSPAPPAPSNESSPPTATGAVSAPDTAPSPAPQTSPQPQPQPQPAAPAESAPQHAEVQNKNKVIVLGDSLSEGAGPKLELGNVTPHWKSGRYVSSMRQIFERIPESECRGGTLYVLGGSNDLFDKNRSVDAITADLQKIYTLAKARGMKVIAATLPPLGNSKYLGSTSSHVQNEAELRAKWDALNNWILGREGSQGSTDNPNGPDKVLRFHEIFANPSDKYVLRAEYRSADGVHMTPNAYTLMAGHIRDAALQFETQQTNPAPSSAESVPAATTPANVFRKASSPREFVKTNNVPPINGPTAFFGSSSIAGISKVPYLKNGGHQYSAKNGLTAGELQKMAHENAGTLKNYKNAVVLIGTNDIGSNKSSENIFNDIKAVWDTIINGNSNINLHVCTLPPFGNYIGYSKNKAEIDAKRLAVNEKIREAARNNPKLKLIDLCLPVEQGGLATPNGAALDPSVSYKQDPLHAESNALAIVLGRAINSES